MLQARWLVLFVCMFSQILLSSQDNAIRALSEASNVGDLPEVQRLLQDSRVIDSLNKNPNKYYIDEVLQVYDIQEPLCCIDEVAEMTVLWEAYMKFQKGDKELIRDVLFKIPFILKAATKQDFWLDRMQLAVNKMFGNDSDRMRLFMQYIVTDNTQKVLANRYLKACNEHTRLIPVPKHNPKLGIFGHDTRKLSERLQESVDVHQDVLSSSVSKMNLEELD